jgi:hypothetical protein
MRKKTFQLQKYGNNMEQEVKRPHKEAFPLLLILYNILLTPPEELHQRKKKM